MESLEEFDEVVYEPDEAFVESTNVYEFMQAYGIDDHEELIERTTTEVSASTASGGSEDMSSGVEWFWDVLPDHLGVEWYDDFDRVRDDTETDGLEVVYALTSSHDYLSQFGFEGLPADELPERLRTPRVWSPSRSSTRWSTNPTRRSSSPPTSTRSCRSTTSTTTRS